MQSLKSALLGQAPALLTRLERLARGKHSILLRTYVNFERKKFNSIVPKSEVTYNDKHSSLLRYGITTLKVLHYRPRGQFYKTSKSTILGCNKLKCPSVLKHLHRSLTFHSKA